MESIPVGSDRMFMKTIRIFALGTTLFLSVPHISEAAAVIRAGSGVNAAAVQPLVDQFRIDLGGVNNGSGGGPFTTGFRAINWDGVPDSLSSPNALPFNFFNSTSPRGIAFSTPGTGFQVSADGSNPSSSATLFANIDPSYAGQFQAFSAERLFSPIGSTALNLSFFVPSSPAMEGTVNGFGAIFVDVDQPDSTYLEFLDLNDNVLSTVFVPSSTSGGLSFVGVSFNDGQRISGVRITSGNVPIGPGILDGGLNDVVVMDDFLLGEPQAVPEPSAMVIVLAGAGLLVLRRFRKVISNRCVGNQ